MSNVGAPAGRRRRASMREVAALADVAISSVSRVLSGHEEVSPAMRARVLDAVAQLGYEPDHLAQSLRRGQTQSVGVVLGDISNPVLADVLLGAESGLRQAGYTALVALNPAADPAVDAQRVRFLATRRVDGLIVASAGEDDAVIIDALRRVEIPLVVVDRVQPPDVVAGAAVSDHGAGVREAATHLVRLGHRRLAFVTASGDTLPVRARAEALRAVVDETPGAELTIAAGPITVPFARTAALELLARPGPPTAIFAGGLRHLAGVLDAARESGLGIPADLSVVVCDDSLLARLHSPAIACVARDSVALGREAGLILGAMLGGGEPSTSVLPTTFDPRQSCGPAPAA